MVDHRGVVLLHLGSGPHAELDAVARVGHLAFHVDVGEETHDPVFDDIGAEMFYHCVVLRIVAGGENDALFRAGENILTGLGIAEIGACAASVFHDELLGEISVALFHVAGSDGGFHVFVQVDALVRQKLHRGRIAGEGFLAPVVVLGQWMENGDEEIAGILIGDGGTGLFGVVELGVRRYPPVEDVTDVVGPF